MTAPTGRLGIIVHRLVALSTALLVASALGAPLVAHGQRVEPVVVAPETARASSFEFRAGGVYQLGERNYLFSGALKSSVGTVTGAEVMTRWRYVGFTVRTFDAHFGDQPEVVTGDATLLLGPPGFSVLAGYGKRAISSALATQVYSYAKFGAQSVIAIGGTGVRATIGGAAYSPLGVDKDRMTKGLEGETSVIYTPAGSKFYLMVGYRVELVTTRTSGASGAAMLSEELRGMRAGIGLQFGGR